jgi:hypothetical protein
MPAANSPDGRFARAKVMQWLFFEQYYVEPVIGSLRFWTLTGRLEINKDLVAGKRDAAMRALSALERTLRATQFLGGSDFTIADIANYAYAHLSADCGFPLAGFPGIARWADRVAGIVQGLMALGARVSVNGDDIEIHGGTRLTGAVIETHDDHRLAMTFAIAGLIAGGATTVRQPGSAAVSYPGFFRELEGVRA